MSSQAAFADAEITVTVAPPPLPVYEQPPAPGPGYLWTPGYWAWGPEGYYWVPGTWVLAPAPGLLWTPGYWAWWNGAYVWHRGYWGPRVGFYGGVVYGFGYFGTGFAGGYWRGPVFYYNTAVTRVNTTIIHNTYVNQTVVTNVNNRVSYNGGNGGLQARPSPEEEAAFRERRMGPVEAQLHHERIASRDRSGLASVNHGVPGHAAIATPAHSLADFRRGSVPSRGWAAPVHPAGPHLRPGPAAWRAPKGPGMRMPGGRHRR